MLDKLHAVLKRNLAILKRYISIGMSKLAQGFLRAYKLISYLNPGWSLSIRLLFSILLIIFSSFLYMGSGELDSSTESTLFIGDSYDQESYISVADVNVYVTYHRGFSPWGIMQKPTEIEVQLLGINVTNGSLPLWLPKGEAIPSSLIGPDCNISTSNNDHKPFITVHEKPKSNNDTCSLRVKYKLGSSEPRGTLQIISFVKTTQINLFIITDQSYHRCRSGNCIAPSSEHQFAAHNTQDTIPSYRTNSIFIPVYSTNGQNLYGYGLRSHIHSQRDDWPELHSEGERQGTIVSRNSNYIFKTNLFYEPGHLFTLYQNIAIILLTLSSERFFWYIRRYKGYLTNTGSV